MFVSRPIYGELEYLTLTRRDPSGPVRQVRAVPGNPEEGRLGQVITNDVF
ncbi:MAG TPA: hypothetical protein VFS50_02670 [Meiothermus sp.]|jgi:hypothetical protein|nr:hypothetical protein [Meiothermus sp.]